jgi:hypothetical protein
MLKTMSKTIVVTKKHQARDALVDQLADDVGDDAREEDREGVHHALDQRHRHHVAVLDVRHLVGEDAFDLFTAHRAHQAARHATRLERLLGPVAKAFTSGES